MSRFGKEVFSAASVCCISSVNCCIFSVFSCATCFCHDADDLKSWDARKKRPDFFIFVTSSCSRCAAPCLGVLSNALALRGRIMLDNFLIIVRVLSRLWFVTCDIISPINSFICDALMPLAGTSHSEEALSCWLLLFIFILVPLGVGCVSKMP